MRMDMACPKMAQKNNHPAYIGMVPFRKMAIFVYIPQYYNTNAN